MEPIWITVWLTTTAFLSPATHYNVLQEVEQYRWDDGAVAIMSSTREAGQYIESFTSAEVTPKVIWSSSTYSPNSSLQIIEYSPKGVAPKRVFRVTEQNLLLDKEGQPIFLGSKFKAPFEWAVVSGPEILDWPNKDNFGVYYIQEKGENYTLFKSTTDCIGYTLQKAKQTGLKYRIYRGNEYDFQDRTDYSFKPR